MYRSLKKKKKSVCKVRTHNCVIIIIITIRFTNARDFHGSSVRQRVNEVVESRADIFL